MDPIQRLTRDLKSAAVTLSDQEARYLVDSYYLMQRNRLRAEGQIRAMTESAEPHEVLAWLFMNTKILEGNIQRALGAYAQSREVGQWSQSIIGIGPVISAGLLAYIRLNPWRCDNREKNKKSCKQEEPCSPRCQRKRLTTVGQIWRYAGLDPTVTWQKGELMPWNANLKVLCWKIGESFMKVSNHKDDFYGHIYAKRRAYEEEKNERGDYADQAARSLTEKRYGKTTEAYKAYVQGKLPAARILRRAQRYAVKLFLSHWFEVAYESTWGESPPAVYALAHLEHTDYIPVPNR